MCITSNNKGQVFVSIIVSVYNTDKEYVQQFFDSITTQTYTNWECIFVDNGSTIDYHDMLVDDRIKYLRLEQNLGIFLAYQCGFTKSNGEYIIYCDSDDWLDENYLKTFVYHVDPKYDTYFMGTISVFENEYKEKSIWANKGLQDYTGLEWFNALCERKQSSWALWGKILKRELVDEVYRKLNVNEHIVFAYDCLFIVVYSTLASSVKNIPFNGFYYRIHSQSMTHSSVTKEKIFKHLHDEGSVIRYLSSFLDAENLPISKIRQIREEFGINFTNIFFQLDNWETLYEEVVPKIQSIYGIKLVPPQKSLWKTIFPKHSILYRFIRFIIIKLYRKFNP